MTARTEAPVRTRRTTIEELLAGCAFGEPDHVEAVYRLAGLQLFIEAHAAIMSVTSARQVNQWYTELLWYHETCKHFRQKLRRGVAVSWMLHREDDRCGFCGSVHMEGARRLDLDPMVFVRDMLAGIQLRVCSRCIEVHQKLREAKDCA